MQTLLFRAVLLAMLSYLPFQTMAWGLLGHRVVGEIAERHLTTSTKRKLQKLMGNESLAMGSNWADFIKSDTNYRHMNAWHYINFDSGISYQQMKDFLDKDKDVDAYTRLLYCMDQLKRKDLPHEEKMMYLRMIVHIVGDMHQPLHASAKGTVGGNQVRVNWFGESSNLHRVWDEDLIRFQELSYTEMADAINFSTKDQRKQWQQQPVSEWLYESYTLSNAIHAEVKPGQRLMYEYNFKYQQIMYDQLLKGGIRLAGLLNDLFKDVKI